MNKEIMLNLFSVIMIIAPAFFSLVIHMCLRHGEVGSRKRVALYFLYLIVINAVTIGVAYLRGVTGLNFLNMTMSYRLKYIGLGCVLGFIVPFFVCLLTEDVITLGGFKRYAIRFVKDVRRYLPYAIISARSDLQAEVASSYLNWMWWLIEPICMMLIYTMIFGVVFKASEEHFAIFVFVGITVWEFFRRTISDSVDIVRRNREIVTKIYMPKYVLLLARMFVNFFKMMVSCAVILLMMIVFRVHVNINILWVIPVLMVLFLFTFGLGSILMHYGVYVSDLGYIVTITLQILMYMTGVFYSLANQVPAPFGTLLETFNPVAYLMSAIRSALIYGTTPAVGTLVIWAFISLILIALGVFTVYSNENSYVKVI